LPNLKKRKNAIVEYLDYQIPVTHLNGQKENGDASSKARLKCAVDRFKRYGR